MKNNNNKHLGLSIYTAAQTVCLCCTVIMSCTQRCDTGCI